MSRQYLWPIYTRPLDSAAQNGLEACLWGMVKHGPDKEGEDALEAGRV